MSLEHRLIKSSVSTCFFSIGDSDDDIQSVKRASTVASKVKSVIFLFFSSCLMTSHF